jgi:hypothetical protein
MYVTRLDVNHNGAIWLLAVAVLEFCNLSPVRV